jgi:hypothetical protein
MKIKYSFPVYCAVQYGVFFFPEFRFQIESFSTDFVARFAYAFEVTGIPDKWKNHLLLTQSYLSLTIFLIGYLSNLHLACTVTKAMFSSLISAKDNDFIDQQLYYNFNCMQTTFIAEKGNCLQENLKNQFKQIQRVC